MFKIKCSKCNEKISKSYDYCPYCGNKLSSNNSEDYGFLGKNDVIDEDFFPKSSFLDKLVGKAIKEIPNMMKMIEKQLQDSPKNNKNPNFPENLKMQFFINGKNIMPSIKEKKENAINRISSEKLKQMTLLPKTEPESKLKRISGKLVYELEVPGVENLEDVLISQLENSIEVKAVSEDKCYSKTININLPILRYGLNKGSLILEFKS